MVRLAPADRDKQIIELLKGTLTSESAGAEAQSLPVQVLFTLVYSPPPAKAEDAALVMKALAAQLETLKVPIKKINNNPEVP